MKKKEILPSVTTWRNLKGHYAEQSKSDGESQMPYDLSHK